METKPNVRGGIGVENNFLFKYSRLANELFIEVREIMRHNIVN
jgi:hypothetical protein